MMSELDQACKNLQAAEMDYIETINEIQESIRKAVVSCALSESSFHRVIQARMEVRRLTCIGTELADKVYGAAQ